MLCSLARRQRLILNALGAIYVGDYERRGEDEEEAMCVTCETVLIGNKIYYYICAP